MMLLATRKIVMQQFSFQDGFNMILPVVDRILDVVTEGYPELTL